MPNSFPLSLLPFFFIANFRLLTFPKKQYNCALEELMSPLNRPVVRRMLTLFAVLPLIVLCAGCSDFWVSDSSIQTVTVSPTAVILRADATTPDTYTLSSSSLTVGGTTATDTTTAKWTSSNTAAVTAASDGVITATAAVGTATVTATDGGVGGTCAVYTYTGTAPSSLTVTATGFSSGATVTAGTYQLHAFLGSSTTEVTNYVSWTTSNSTGATISTTGLLTVLSVSTSATVTITAQANLGAPAGTAIPTAPEGTLQFTAD